MYSVAIVNKPFWCISESPRHTLGYDKIISIGTVVVVFTVNSLSPTILPDYETKDFVYIFVNEEIKIMERRLTEQCLTVV